MEFLLGVADIITRPWRQKPRYATRYTRRLFGKPVLEDQVSLGIVGTLSLAASVV